MFTDTNTTPNQNQATSQPSNQPNVFFTLKEPCSKKKQNPSFEFVKQKDKEMLTFYSNVKTNLLLEFPPHTRMKFKIHLEFQNKETNCFQEIQESKCFKLTETHSTNFLSSIEREGLFPLPFRISFHFENYGSYKKYPLRLVVCMCSEWNVFQFNSDEFCIMSKYIKKKSEGCSHSPPKLKFKLQSMGTMLREDFKSLKRNYEEIISSQIKPRKRLKTLEEPFAHHTALGTTTLPIPNVDQENVELEPTVGELYFLDSDHSDQEEEEKEKSFESKFDDDFYNDCSESCLDAGPQ
jgi:hypothetical protein